LISGSITRASCIDDVRSQTGHYSSKVSARSIADGQSQHSFSNNSTRYFSNTALASNLVSTRPGWLLHMFVLLAFDTIFNHPTYCLTCAPFQNYGNHVSRWRPLRTECRGPTSATIICHRTHRPGDSDHDRVTAIWSQIRRDLAADIVWLTPRILSTTTTKTTGLTTTWIFTWLATLPRGAVSCHSKYLWPPCLVVHSCSSVFSTIQSQ